MWENAFFFAFCSRMTSCGSPKWKACTAKAFAFMCLRRARACVSSRFRFRVQVATRESIGQKGTKRWERDPRKPKKSHRLELHTTWCPEVWCYRVGNTPYNIVQLLLQGMPLDLRLEESRVGASFQQRWLPRQGELSTSNDKDFEKILSGQVTRGTEHCLNDY